MIVYAYQVYLWIRQGSWTRITSRVLLPRAVEGRLLERSGAMGTVLDWILNVELAYTLCAIAMVFFAFKWLAERKGKQEQKMGNG